MSTDRGDGAGTDAICLRIAARLIVDNAPFAGIVAAMSVQTNIKAAKDAELAVKSHCMCLRFETTGTHYRVIYPDGYFPNGVQATKRLGKTEALTRLLAAMERHWTESFPK